MKQRFTRKHGGLSRSGLAALRRTAAHKITLDAEVLAKIVHSLPLASILKMRKVSQDCLNAASNSAKFKTAFKHGLTLPPRPSEQVLAVPELSGDGLIAPSGP